MMRTKNTAVRLALLILFTCLGILSAQAQWVGSWATSQQLAEPRNSITAEDLKDVTLRQTVRLSIAGPQIRLRLSNRFGIAPVHFTAVHVAKPAAGVPGGIVPETDKVVKFSGEADFVIPPGADFVSDPVWFPVAALSDVVITLHTEAIPELQTGHPGSRTTSYLAHGDLVSAAALPDAKKIVHWYFISGIDVVAPQASAVAILGDSITDGYGTTTDGNDRWPDFLMKRLQATAGMQNVAVLNHGIGGNNLLHDGLGPSALARFDHDVLLQTGVRTLMIFEGVNDLGGLARMGEVPEADHKELVRRIIDAYEQMIARAKARGIRVIGGTITPFVGSEYYHPGAATEADRQAINQWIRTSGRFDAVVDFDQVLRDPEHPERLLAKYDNDHLHPSVAGYSAMAEAISLTSLLPASSTVQPKLAFTFDDLPAHATLPQGETRMEVANKIISALREFKVPSTYGFVNAQGLEKTPADINVLQAWVAAGNKLGNHTWSHMNLNQHSMQEYREEIQKDEPVLKKVMKKQDYRWLRFPFLARGDTPEKRAEVRDYLHQHGYKIAGVTMSFADYLYSDPYARCVAKGDTNAIGLLESSYLAAADEDITYRRELSQRLYGRDIPYVLLMHLGAFEARMMPQLLELYRSRGFQFVTLEEAEKDEFYKTEVDTSLPAVPDNLEGTMMQRGLQVPPHSIAQPNFDNFCR